MGGAAGAGRGCTELGGPAGVVAGSHAGLPAAVIQGREMGLPICSHSSPRQVVSYFKTQGS